VLDEPTVALAYKVIFDKHELFSNLFVLLDVHHTAKFIVTPLFRLCYVITTWKNEPMASAELIAEQVYHPS
jgi:hypothetical protein